MKLIVDKHRIKLVKEEDVNEKERNVSEVSFEFVEDITDDFVKEAYFTLNDGPTYKEIIVNNKCGYPSEVLAEKGTIKIGVVAYKVINDDEIRYNPSPVYVETLYGTLTEAQNSEPITPSEMEQYEQALQDGLEIVNDKIEEIDEAITDAENALDEAHRISTEVENLDVDVSKEGKITTISITKKDGTTKTEQVIDGEKGDSGISLFSIDSRGHLLVDSESASNYERYEIDDTDGHLYLELGE